MSKVSRIEMLKTFASEEPENPFNLYALALEFIEYDLDSASFYFEKLLKEFPEYLPTYFHAAGFYAEKGDLNFAKEIYDKGIRLADFQKDEKSFKELKNSFQNFLFENDLS